MIEFLKSYYLNYRGFKSDRKLLVIESDDWGSLRMPSKDAYNSLLENGIQVDKCGYLKYDQIEGSKDLEIMFDLLSKILDCKGNFPTITANTIVANPDFEKIKKSNFNEYYFETIEDSYEKYSDGSVVLKLMDEGKKEGLFFPQLHGREHVYIDNWMSSLKKGDKDTLLAFEHCVYGLSTTISNTKRKSFLTALDFDNIFEVNKHLKVLEDAQFIFTNSFKYSSESFIAPNYTWHPKHEDLLNQIGVKVIQGARAQQIPQESTSKAKYLVKKHYMGERNLNNQIYLIRNASFEPSVRKNNWFDSVLKSADFAFNVGAPLIISSHRVNFMGGMDEKNSVENLKLLVEILTKIKLKYPEVEFINSVQLAKIINDEKYGI